MIGFHTATMLSEEICWLIPTVFESEALCWFKALAQEIRITCCAGYKRLQDMSFHTYLREDRIQGHWFVWFGPHATYMYHYQENALVLAVIL